MVRSSMQIILSFPRLPCLEASNLGCCPMPVGFNPTMNGVNGRMTVGADVFEITLRPGMGKKPDIFILAALIAL